MAGTAAALGGAAGIGEQGKNRTRRSLKAIVNPKEELEVAPFSHLRPPINPHIDQDTPTICDLLEQTDT